MSRTRRVMISLLAPAVVLIGMGGLWAGRTAVTLKAQIEAWVDSLERSPNPVEMNLSFIPMYVDGDKVGMLRTVVVQRQQPGAIDSVRLVIEVGDRGLAGLEACQLRFDPDAFDRDGPFGFKQAFTCVDDVEGLVPFGSVRFAGVEHDAVLFLDASDLPCHRGVRSTRAECAEPAQQFRDLRVRIGKDIEASLREAEVELDRVRIEVKRATEEARAAIRKNRL